MNKNYILTTFVLLSLISCGTTRNSYISKSAMESFRIDNIHVSVAVDLVEEKNAAFQIEQMIKPLFYEQGSDSKKIADLYIQVNQRSIMQGIKPIHSVYISADVILQDGTTLISEHNYLSGKTTLLSAKSQFKHIMPLVQNIITIQQLGEPVSSKDITSDGSI